MKWNRKYNYPFLLKTNLYSKRYYITPKGKLPSVTTILSSTKNDENLQRWKFFVGEKRAEQEKKQATSLGSLMHKKIEDYIRGEQKEEKRTNYIYELSEKMSSIIFLNYLKNGLEEVWGLEESLFYPELYAGTVDCIGVYEGEETIIDFKTAKKLRTIDQIEDYFLQLCAYIDAHNFLFNTNIKTGLIIMVSRDLECRKFEMKKEDYKKYREKWLDRLEIYYKNQA